MYEDLRAESFALLDIDFDGIALGGLSVGDQKRKKQILAFMADKLPTDKPIYLGCR